MSNGRGCFGIKQYDSDLYTWCPLPNDIRRQILQFKEIIQPTYCNAIPGSQGQDWITTYDYNITVGSDGVERLAYMACDYVS
jgi:hypothetical protein